MEPTNLLEVNFPLSCQQISKSFSFHLKKSCLLYSVPNRSQYLPHQAVSYILTDKQTIKAIILKRALILLR